MTNGEKFKSEFGIYATELWAMSEDDFLKWLKAKAEPIRHGRWKPFDLTWGRSVYACTSCGEAFEVPTEGGKPMYDYCPNCGAKMDKGIEDE